MNLRKQLRSNITLNEHRNASIAGNQGGMKQIDIWMMKQNKKNLENVKPWADSDHANRR